MLLIYVYRDSLGDCTLNGVSSRYDCLKMIEESEVPTWTGDRDDVVVKINRILWGEPAPYLVPLDLYEANKNASLPIMFGGNFGYTSDSRFGSSPIAIHDRCETWEMYNSMCD